MIQSTRMLEESLDSQAPRNSPVFEMKKEPPPWFCLRQSFWYFDVSLATLIVFNFTTVVRRIKNWLSKSRLSIKCRMEERTAEIELSVYF